MEESKVDEKSESEVKTFNGTKIYKLNKTFENSIYPIEVELKDINKNTLSITLNNTAAAIFSGIGTSILFHDNCLPGLLRLLYGFMGISESGILTALLNIAIVAVLFILLYLLGRAINKKARKEHKLIEKKATSEGRSELSEIFHKSVINDIVTGISFVDKAEELNYDGNVAVMYLYESAYYFIRAKIQMEKIELLSPEENENHRKFIKETGYDTIRSTCKVYNMGLEKLKKNIPEGTEKEEINDIIKAIEPYI